MNNNDYIRENIKEVRKRINNTALKVGRNPQDIKIIGVTKTIDTEKINVAIEEKIIDLGENRVQELNKKYDIIKKSCNWHLIGHLQTNKVKYIIDKVSLIHSVDGIDLVKEIQNRAQAINRTMDILVQVNVSGEESKFGIAFSEVHDFLKVVSSYSNIRVKGLMTIAPYTQNIEEIRWVFKDLKKLSVDITKENIDNINMCYLSMGMSNDFEIAIEEGANMVRIGSAIFGERVYRAN